MKPGTPRGAIVTIAATVGQKILRHVTATEARDGLAVTHCGLASFDMHIVHGVVPTCLRCIASEMLKG